MRILFVSAYSELYGANRSLMTLATYFSKRPGVKVAVIMPKRGDLTAELAKKGIESVVTPYFAQLFYWKWQLKYLSLPLLFLYSLFMFPAFVRKVRRFNPDVIYSNSSTENIGVWTAKLLGKKHIVHVREFMDLDFSAHFIGGRRLKRRFFNLSDRQIFVSQSVASWVNMSHPLNDSQTVIYNGVDTQCSELPQHLKGNHIHFGIVGIFDEAKGQLMAVEYMADVIKQYPQAVLHIYGDKECSYKRKVERLVRQLHLEDVVVCHGFVKDARQIYEGMDVLLMCSRAEGFGRVTIEAMQFGVPVVGLNNGGTTELVKDGFSGYLFSSKEEFLRKINLLLSSEEHYRTLSCNAFHQGHTFTTERYCQQVEQVIADCVES